MKLSTREQNLLWIILVFLIGFLVYNYSYTPLTEEIESLKDKSSNLEFEIDKLHGIESLIVTTKKEIVELTNKLKNDHNDIPDSWDDAELLYHVEGIIPDIVTRKNLTLRLNDDEDIEVASGFVILEMVSEYEEFMEILDLLKNLNILMN
ncbi:MAG TPA: hypothetical protein GXZ90_05820 [Clostridiales bacterium]|nr:hypothetical protein [Clostridiales bacterium]